MYSKICFDGVILDMELYPEHIRNQPWFATAPEYEMDPARNAPALWLSTCRHVATLLGDG